MIGAQELSKNEQKNINGSIFQPNANTGYVSTLSNGPIVNQCEIIDDCPMQVNADGSLKSPICKPTAYGTRCFYSSF